MTYPVVAALLAVLLAPPAARASDDQAPAPLGNPEGAYAPGIELPESPGRELLIAACTRCHDLAGLEAYKGYWTHAQWRAMVDDMVKNGARLTVEGRAIVTDYLFRHYGRSPAP